MPVPTNRAPGQLISSSDINALALLANTTESAVEEVVGDVGSLTTQVTALALQSPAGLAAALDAEEAARIDGDMLLDQRVDTLETTVVSLDGRVDVLEAAPGGGGGGAGLPAGLVSTADYAEQAEQVVADGETLTGWSGAGIGTDVPASLDTVNKTTGASSFRAGVQTSNAGNFLRYTPATPVQIDSGDALILDVRYTLINGSAVGLSTVWKLQVASGPGMTGTVMTFELDGTSPGAFATMRFNLTGLAQIGSFQFAALGQLESGGRQHVFYIDNVRVGGRTSYDEALDSAPTVSVIVPATYVPSSVMQEYRAPDSNKVVLDLRPGKQWLTGLGGVRHLRDFLVPEDGVTECTAAINRAFAGLRPGDTLLFPAGKKFYCDRLLTLNGTGVTVDMNGSAIYLKRHRSGDPSLNDRSLQISGKDIVLRRGAFYGYRERPTNGNNTSVITGTAAVSGTTRLLTAQNEGVRNPSRGDHASLVMHARAPLQAYPAGVQSQLLAQDPNYDTGNAFTATLSDSAQVPGDAMIYAVKESGPSGTLATSVGAGDLTVTVTLLGLENDAPVPGTVFLIDGELFFLEGYVSPTVWTVRRGANGSVATSHSAGAAVRPVLSARALTLTATPTAYSIPAHSPELQTPIQFRVVKATAATNTITVHSIVEYGHLQYSLASDQSSTILVINAQNVLIEDMLIEGSATDAYEVSDALTKNLHIRRTLVRCANRQGMSFNQGEDFRVEDFWIVGTGRSGIDIEPFASHWYTRRLSVRGGRMDHIFNYGFAVANWGAIFDLDIDNVVVNRCLNGSFIYGGAKGGRITNCRATATGASNYTFVIDGQNLQCANLVGDKGVQLGNFADTWNPGTGIQTYLPDDNVVDGVVVTGGGFDCQIGQHGRGNSIRNVSTTSAQPQFGGSSYPSVHGEETPRQVTGRLDSVDSMYTKQYPRSFPSPVSTLPPTIPGGTPLHGMPVLDLNSVAAARYVSLLSVASRTTSGTGATVDLGGRGGYAGVAVELTGYAGATTLTFGIEGSPDGSNWQSIWSNLRLDSAIVHPLRALPRYIRVTWQVAGGGITFGINARVSRPGRNLSGIGQVVAAGASAATVVFPSGRPRPRFESTQTPSIAADATSTLLAGTYYYRVAARTVEAGPGVWLPERTLTYSAAAQRGQFQIDRFHFGNVSDGIHTDGVTILRGTSPGVYDTRFDWLPTGGRLLWKTRHASLNFNDRGGVVDFDNANFTPYPASVTPTLEGPFLVQDETGFEPDTLYVPTIMTSWDAGHPYVTAKRANGFDVAFPYEAPSGGGTFDWVLVR